MKTDYTAAWITGLIAVAGIVTPVQAQDGPRAYQKKVVDAIKEQKWGEALEAAEHCIKVYEPRRKSLGLDDGFGWFYYQKGVCLAQLKNYQGAVEAFHDCYTKFPAAQNQLGKMALFREGENYCRLNEFAKGAEALEKFLKEYRSDPIARKVNPAEVQGFLAQCYFKAEPPKFSEGLRALTDALNAHNRGRTVSDGTLSNAFLAMLNTAIKTDKCAEANEFIKAHPGLINLGATRSGLASLSMIGDIAGLLEKSGNMIKEGQMEQANPYATLAFTLMGLIPDQNKVALAAAYDLDRLGRQARSVGNVADLSHTVDREKANNVLAKYTDLDKEGRPVDSYLFGFMGNQALLNGSNRVARAAYQLLIDSFPKAPGREDNLYYLAMTTWQLGDAEKGDALIKQHLQEFPDSRYAPLLNTLALEGLLKDKQFELCVQQADKVMQLHKDDPKHQFYELALFCKGASLFNLGSDHAEKYKEAEPILARFVKEYRDSKYLKTAMQLLGETYTNLNKTDDAIQTFTEYIARYPDKNDPDLAQVLYNRSFNYMGRKNDGDEEHAAADAKTIVDNFPEHRLFPYANNLLANLYSGVKGKEEEVKGYLKAALESAKKQEERRPASEALYFLFVNATQAPVPADPDQAAAAKKANRDEAKSWYEQYWKDGDDKGNRFSLQLAAAGMDFFKADAEMFDPATKKLQEIIVREGTTDNPAMINLVEESVNSYTKAYIGGNEAQGRPVDGNALRAHFYRFPGVDTNKDKTLASMLRMAVISQTQERYEKMPTETEEQRNAKFAMEGLISQLFNELKRDFAPSDLPPFTLIKLGTHLANAGGRPEESIAYFDEVLDPQEPDPGRKRQRLNSMAKYRKNAVFGKAVALGNSNNPANIDKAIAMMREELDSESKGANPDKKTMEDALYNLVRFTFKREDWNAAIAAADQYRDNKANTKNLPEVLLLQGRAYAKAGDTDKALINFSNITGAYKGMVKWSGPALLDQMETLWNRNKPSQGRGKQPSDRYTAWNIGDQYVRLLDTDTNRRKMTVEDSKLLNDVKAKVAQFANDGAVAQERADIAEYNAALKAAKGKK